MLAVQSIGFKFSIISTKSDFYYLFSSTSKLIIVMSSPLKTVLKFFHFKYDIFAFCASLMHS